uniref:FLZ-type domain-containing protein n=1 Tax=Arundo donax TaxID=35708 RepID=A0A0A9H7R7_ARUDO
MEAMELKEGAESYWLVKCSGDAGEEFLTSSCLSCNKKMEGNDACNISRGEKAFCSGNCKDQEILIEEEEDNSTAVSSLTSIGSTSSLNDDIFMAGMVVLTGLVDAELP